MTSDLEASNFNLRFVTHQSFYLEDAEIDDVLIEAQAGVSSRKLVIDPIKREPIPINEGNISVYDPGP